MAAADPGVTLDDIVEGLRAVGLRHGDTCFFHSSLSSFGHVTGGADAVVDGLLSTVGSSGTIVAPTFTLETTGESGEFGSWWNIDSTPSSVGLISEVVRKRADSHRSDHPIHSVAAIGANSVRITQARPNRRERLSPWPGSFSVGGPFDQLVALGARYLLLGVGFETQTMCHYVKTLLVERRLEHASQHTPDKFARLKSEVAQTWPQVWRDGVLLNGVWPNLDRVKIGQYLVTQGQWRHTTIGRADVWCADTVAYITTVLHALEHSPECWLKDVAFLRWYREAGDAVIEVS